MTTEPLSTETVRRQNVGAVTISHLCYSGGGGARVPACLLQAAQPDGSAPALLLLHGANGSKDDFYIQAPAQRWAAQGWTILTIDLAEHGERVVAEPLDPMQRRRLITDPAFVKQGVADLRRGVDLLMHTAAVDPKRIAFVGFSLGGMLGTVFAAQEPRISIVATAIAGSFAHTRYWERGESDSERRRRRDAAQATDPAFFAAAIAPRPFLMVNTENDPVFPRAAVMALFDAARDPKELRWHPGTHHQWSAKVYKDIWSFLKKHLDP